MRQNHWMKTCGKISALIFCTLLGCLSTAQAEDRPNIVLVFMDNFGWGEPGFNGGGIIRGAPTPRIDRLASEGLRLTNFNVESQCTPSRAAIMSGRYAIRTGNGSIPLGGGVYGLVQWEVTMAEMLSDTGYSHRHVREVASGSHGGQVPDGPGFRRVVRHPQLHATSHPGIRCCEGFAESGVEESFVYEVT